MTWRAIRHVIAAAVWGEGLAVMLACGGAGEVASPITAPTPSPTPSGPTPTKGHLVEIWVEGGYPVSRLTVDSLEQRLEAGRGSRGRMSDSSVVDVAATWTSSDTSVATIGTTSSTTTMVVLTHATGRSTITVRRDSLSASYVLVVTPQHLRQVIIQHAPTATTPFAAWVGHLDSLIIRTTPRYVASCADAGASAIPGARLTWHTSDPTRATVDSIGTVTARALGGTYLVASCAGPAGDTRADSIKLVIRPPRAARLAFAYAPDSLMLNHSDSVRAVLYDSAGQAIAVAPQVLVRAWDEFNSALTNGQLRARYLGAVDIEASGDGLVAHHALRVYAVPTGPPRTYPSALALAPATRALIIAFPADLDGTQLTGPSPTYAVDNAAVATITADGIVTAAAVGNTTLHVRTGTFQTDVPVTVIAPGALHMAVQPATAAALPASFTTAATTAIGRWQGAILNGLSPLHLTLPPDACGLDTPPAGELSIDGVTIFASVDSLDGPGGVLAQAGPCVIRADGTPAIGRLQVDAADLATLAASGQLVTVLQHELGHVLGIGTLWNRASLGFVSKSGNDWGYAGPRGLRVATWWNRTNAVGVPLGEAGGPGTGHWSEASFGVELMTPYLGPGTNPLSLLTLEALGDLGYTTSAAAAEWFLQYPGAGASPAALRAIRATRAPDALRTTAAPAVPFDRVLTPQWRVVGPGRLVRLPTGPGGDMH